MGAKIVLTKILGQTAGSTALESPIGGAKLGCLCRFGKRAAMTPLLIVLITAPALYWVYRKGKSRRAPRQRSKPELRTVRPEPIETPRSETNGQQEGTTIPERTSGQTQEAADARGEEHPQNAPEYTTKADYIESPITQKDSESQVVEERPALEQLGLSAAVAEAVGPELLAERSAKDIELEAAQFQKNVEESKPTSSESRVAEEIGSMEDLTAWASIPAEVRPDSAAEQTVEDTTLLRKCLDQAVVANLPAQPSLRDPAPVAPNDNSFEFHATARTNDAVSDSSHTLAPEVDREGEQLAEARRHPSVSENAMGPPVARYRPPVQRPPRAPRARAREETWARPAQTESALEIQVHLTFDRSSFCTIGFLPKRLPESDQDIEVRSGKEIWRLLAQEDWYQDIEVENMGDRLHAGIDLRGVLADDREVRWQLKGRDIYVLAAHPRAAGYVSTPRLLLGRTDVVLCFEDVAREAEDVLVAAGCQGYTRIDESLGVPHGWVGFRGVTPTNALALDLGADRFYALKPAPDIDIEFEGGVCIRNSAWLAGYPPRIKLYGQQSEIGAVLIDGREARPSHDGSLVVDGYDRTGEHSVYCEGLSRSRTYSIEPPPDSWDHWTAYRFGSGGICGPLVQLDTEASLSKVPITVPMSNPLLVGAESGEIFHCSTRNVRRWKGFVPFKVVWALPGQPLTCDKKSARIIQFSDTQPVMPSSRPSNMATSWCNAILDASRKGLKIESEFADSVLRWREYRAAARRLRRAAR